MVVVLDAADLERPGPGHPPPLQAAVRLHQRLLRHLRHRKRPGQGSAGGRLLRRGRADRARPRREHARRDGRADRPAVGAARLPARHRGHLQQAGRDQPQGVRRHLHRGGHLRRNRHGRAGDRHPPRPLHASSSPAAPTATSPATPCACCWSARPQVRIGLIVDGTGALFDPEGADRASLGALVLQARRRRLRPRGPAPGRVPPLPQPSGAPKGCASSTERCVRTDAGLEEQLGHRRRVLPRIQRPALHRPGRPLHSRRRAPGDHRRGQLAALLRQGRGARLPGSSSRGPTPSSPRRPATSCRNRGW